MAQVNQQVKITVLYYKSKKTPYHAASHPEAHDVQNANKNEIHQPCT